MKIKDLIAKLQEFDGDAIALISFESDGEEVIYPVDVNHIRLLPDYVLLDEDGYEVKSIESLQERQKIAIRARGVMLNR